MGLVLIDTSVWIAILRSSPDIKYVKQVQRLLEDGDAAWCPMVQLELWSGVKDSKERKHLKELERVVSNLDTTSQVWEEAYQLAGLARSKGVTAPSTDILIFACAKTHGAEVLHLDKHFDILKKI